MQNNFSGELKTSSLAKVNNVQIKIKSSIVQGTLIQTFIAYLSPRHSRSITCS